MGLTTENIPTITSSVMLLYAIVRLFLTCIKKGKQSIFKYWSRFLFRLLFIGHVIVYLLTTIPSYNKYSILKYIAQGSLPYALAFLVVSIQDFVCYNNREPTFIKRNWIFLDIPFLVLLTETQIMLWNGQITHDDYVIRASRITYEVTLDFFIIMMIVIPAIFFLFEIRKSDFSGYLSTKTIIALIFFFFEIVALLVCSYIEIDSVIRGELYSGVGRATAIIFKSSRDPVMIMLCFTQDMVDWMLKWIYLDEEEVMEEQDDIVRSDPVTVELVTITDL